MDECKPLVSGVTQALEQAGANVTAGYAVRPLPPPLTSSNALNPSFIDLNGIR